jgi:hypothetical protein
MDVRHLKATDTKAIKAAIRSLRSAEARSAKTKIAKLAARIAKRPEPQLRDR